MVPEDIYVHPKVGYWKFQGGEGGCIYKKLIEILKGKYQLQ